MTIHPRSLAWNEDRPARPEWWCELHQRLIVGDSHCPRCDVEQDQAVAS